MYEKKSLARFLVLVLYAVIPFSFIKLFISQLNLPFVILILITLFDYLFISKYNAGFKLVRLMQLAILLIILISLINYVPGYQGGWSVIRQFAFFSLSFFSLTKLIKYSKVDNLTIKQVFSNSVLILSLLGIFGVGATARDGRLFLFGMNPNIVAFLAVVAFGFSFLSTLTRQNIWSRIITYLKLLSYLVVVFLTGSRGAILSLGLLIFMSLFLKEKSIIRRLWYVLFSCLLLLGLYLLVINNSLLNHRFFGSDEVSDAGRVELWKTVWTIYEKSPLIGVGVFEYQSQIEALNNDRIINTHNEFLSFLVYSGIIGLSLFLLFLYRLYKIGISNYRLTGNAEFLLIVVLIVFNIFKAGGALLSPILWALFAYIIVFGNHAMSESLLKKST